MTSCHSTHTKPIGLESQADTLSYLLGVLNSQGLLDYIQKSVGIDSTDMNHFYKGFNDGCKGLSDSEKAYVTGAQIGEKVSQSVFKSLDLRYGSNKQGDRLSKEFFVKGFITQIKHPDQVSTQAAKNYIDKHFETEE